MRARPGELMAFIEVAVASATDDCILWPYGKFSGYGQIKYKKHPRTAHRVALILATGIDPPDKVAAHGPCHTPLCINPKHLSWKSLVENTDDMKRDGTVQYAHKHNAKLTAAQVVEIRQLRSNGWLLRELAQKFGVTEAQISLIVSSKRWK